MREIKISKCMNGYIVNVGCQTIVFESKEKMLVELARFLNDPQGVEKEYVMKFGQESSGSRPLDPVPFREYETSSNRLYTAGQDLQAGDTVYVSTREYSQGSARG